MIPRNVIQIFDADELTFLMSGVQEISLADWKKNTQYKGEFTEKHKVITWFWQIMATLTQDELRKILIFCIGMPRVPIEGFK